MGNQSITYLMGMASMFILMLIGSYLFDNSERDFNELRDSFYAGHALHQSILENRLRIKAIAYSKDISDDRKVSVLADLSEMENSAVLSQMLMYLNTNSKLSPVYQVNMNESEKAIERWLMLIDHDSDELRVNNSNKMNN